MFKVVQIPNVVLTTATKPVQKFDAQLKKIIKEMEKTLDAQTDPEGVGLASTQVGLSMSLFIMKPEPKFKADVFINPTILELDWAEPESAKTDKKKKDSTPLEGCLSIPNIWAPLKRAKRVHVQYQNEEGETHKKWFSGFKSIIVQHEVDHLNGILFTQRCIEADAPLYEEKRGELVRKEI